MPPAILQPSESTFLFESGVFTGDSPFAKTLALVSPSVTRVRFGKEETREQKPPNVLAGHVHLHNLSNGPPRGTIEFLPSEGGPTYHAAVVIKDVHMPPSLFSAPPVMLLDLLFDEIGGSGKPAIYDPNGDQVDLPSFPKNIRITIEDVNAADDILPANAGYMANCNYGSYSSRTELCIGFWNLTMFQPTKSALLEAARFDPEAGSPIYALETLSAGLVSHGSVVSDLPKSSWGRGDAVVATVRSSGTYVWGGDTRIEVDDLYIWGVKGDDRWPVARVNVNWDPYDKNACSSDEYNGSGMGCLLDPDKYSCEAFPGYSCQLLAATNSKEDRQHVEVEDILTYLYVTTELVGLADPELDETTEVIAAAVELTKKLIEWSDKLSDNTYGSLYFGIFHGPCQGIPCDQEGMCGAACTDNYYCLNGTCVCHPICADGAQCGDDGCGGSCGTCPAPSVCVEGHCCRPDCKGKCSGEPDGCNGVCKCPANEVCSEIGMCGCNPPGDWCHYPDNKKVLWDGFRLTINPYPASPEVLVSQAGCSEFNWDPNKHQFKSPCVGCNPPGRWCFQGATPGGWDGHTLSVYGSDGKLHAATLTHPGWCFDWIAQTQTLACVPNCPYDPKTGLPLNMCSFRQCEPDFPTISSCGPCDGPSDECVYGGLFGIEGLGLIHATVCCEPHCEGKQCGGDGCGGTCGTCPEGQRCANGQCCTPDCPPNACGPDGCGGICTTCQPPEVCTADRKCCLPNCKARLAECGDDGCGGLCGVCPEGQTCSPWGHCS
jgi:hypothetical protein